MLTRLIACLQAKGESRLARAFSGALRGVDQILEAETYGDAAGSHGQWASLNMPAFVHLVGMVDVLMDVNSGRYDVTHDVTREFEGLFGHVLKRFNIPDSTATDIGTSIAADGISLVAQP